ncbi:hypothetical protein QBC44DRAFT_383946 [Cladorrhinum sp. PSN332]|nr:hypothetical protein QBC44DRAFT_383946 [Cladorrhinum sp. PSN332]
MSTSESAPLLSTHEPGHGPIHLPLNRGHDGQPSSKRHLTPRIGHWIHLFISPAVAALGITVAAKYQHSPHNYYIPWPVERELPWVITLSIITTIWSLASLLRYRASKNILPSPIGLVFHGPVGGRALSAGVAGIKYFTGISNCEVYRWPEPTIPDRDCLEWARKFEPWLWAYLVLLIVFAAGHLILTLTYAFYAYRASREAWSKRDEWRGGSWGVLVPAYVFTVEFTVKVGRPRPAGEEEN